MLILPDIFTPYIQGREAAIQANWNDRAKFEEIRRAQNNNLFGEMALEVAATRQPGTLDVADVYSQNAGAYEQARYNDAMDIFGSEQQARSLRSNWMQSIYDAFTGNNTAAGGQSMTSPMMSGGMNMATPTMQANSGVGPAVQATPTVPATQPAAVGMTRPQARPAPTTLGDAQMQQRQQAYLQNWEGRQNGFLASPNQGSITNPQAVPWNAPALVQPAANMVADQIFNSPQALSAWAIRFPQTDWQGIAAMIAQGQYPPAEMYPPELLSVLVGGPLSMPPVPDYVPYISGRVQYPQ